MWKIGGIESHKEYNMLSKNGPDTEFALLQKLQEAMQKNTKNLLDSVKELVVLFFKDDTKREKLIHVKFNTLNVRGCQSIMADDHHVFQAFNALPAPTMDSVPTLADQQVYARQPASTC